MNTELMEALTILEKEKNISRDTMIDAIENSLISACKNHFGTSDNIKVIMNRETCDYAVYAEKEVVEEVFDPAIEITLEDAEEIDSALQIGDVCQVPVQSKEFGRIATMNAKNLILQKIREEERKVVYDQYFEKEKDIVTGIVQRYVGKNISVNLGKADAMLTENEQVKGEVFKPTDRIKLYIVEVKNTPKGPKILVSRTHPELVKRLFEAEVAEVKDGTVEIKSIAREAGKKIPMRKCVGCGEMKAKKELLRVLRTEDDEFVLDTTGRKNGRGAYVCLSSECFAKAAKNKGLERSFKQAIPKEVYERLEKEMEQFEAR